MGCWLDLKYRVEVGWAAGIAVRRRMKVKKEKEKKERKNERRRSSSSSSPNLFRIPRS
jgi:hypothetical protein